MPKFRNWYRPIDHFSFILYHPMGLLGLADYALQNGLTAAIVDLGIEKRRHGRIDLASIIADYTPSLIGVTLHWHFQSYDSIEIVRQLKSVAPNIPVVLGGLTASLFSEEIMAQCPQVDFIIKGDAELPLVGLARAVKEHLAVDGVPNLVYRSQGRTVSREQTYVADAAMLDSINFTRFDLIKDYRAYFESLTTWFNLHNMSGRFHRALFGTDKEYPVFLGRGCVNNCSYCGGGAISHRTIGNRTVPAMRSPAAVAASIREIERYGFDHVSLTWDPLPGAAAEVYYGELFDQLARPPVRMSAEIERWSIPTEKFITGFKRTFGPASRVSLCLSHPNEELRKKNRLFFYSNSELEAGLDLLERMGMRTTLFFTCGLPFDNLERFGEQFAYQRMIRKKYRNVAVKTWFIEVEPCSDLSRNPDDYGITLQRRSFREYYDHHALPDRNHFDEIGYLNKGDENDRHLKRYFCSHFCWVFKAGALSPLLCRAVGIAWKLGIFRVIDRALLRGKDEPSTTVCATSSQP